MLVTTTFLFLLLVGLCAATEYYVKPTISQEASCPRESCHTLDELAAKYFYSSATDVLVDNVTVIFLNGTYELKGSIFVREVNDFTLLSTGGIIGESHVEVNCKGVSSLVFDGIINLTITRITFSQCGVLHKFEDLDLPWQAPCTNALTFSDVFNLRLNWVVIHNSTINGILVANVWGTSVIDHSVFQNFNNSGLQETDSFENSWSRHIFIGYSKVCYKCRIKTEFLLHDVKLHICNCVLRGGRSGSMTIELDHAGYKIEVDLMNITVLNGGDVHKKGDISIHIGNKASYVVTLRDSYIGNSKGGAISVAQQHMEANLSQLLHIINSIIDHCAAGIYIHYDTSAVNGRTTTLSQIIVEDGIIMNIRGTSDQLYGGGFRMIIYAEQPQISVVLSNISFENNTFPLHGGINLYLVKAIIELIDCHFVGNQGTPIILYDSTLNLSGTLSFVNNLMLKYYWLYYVQVCW